MICKHHQLWFWFFLKKQQQTAKWVGSYYMSWNDDSESLLCKCNWNHVPELLHVSLTTGLMASITTIWSQRWLDVLLKNKSTYRFFLYYKNLNIVEMSGQSKQRFRNILAQREKDKIEVMVNTHFACLTGCHTPKPVNILKMCFTCHSCF